MSIYNLQTGGINSLQYLQSTDFYATAQAIASATQTLISGSSGTLSADYNNLKSNYSAGVYTCTIPGFYSCSLNLSWGSTPGSGYGYIRIDKHDAALDEITTICGDEANYGVLTTDAPYLSCSSSLWMRVGDTLSFYVYQSSGSPITPNFMKVACSLNH